MSKVCYRIYDIETSELSIYKAKVLSFGGVQLDIDTSTKEFKISNPIHIFINNPDLQYLSQENMNVHGLSVQFLRENGISPDDAADKIFKYLHAQNIAGFNNRKFDDPIIESFLYKAFYSLETASNTDVSVLYQKIYGGRKPSLAKVAEYFNIDHHLIGAITRKLQKEVGGLGSINSHDALYDCVKTALCLVELI